ncbi:MAG: NTP transferase domain-containing protein [Candidatus Bathyarchaeota archaeon]|nr:NTP transferase domain-containing protein [Candidatus Bathyarchaeum tardum]WNZ29758.1 MAG: NTP transferase domain-containing protein [Candidatus Bathyarchaeota archaeon]
MSKINRALVLAAGQGSRLKDYVDQKVVHYVDGVPLLGRILHGLKDAGIESVVIVIGYEADNVQRVIGNDYLGLKVNYVVAENWKKGNLYSFLAAKKEFTAPFVLCMGDHLFDSKIVEKLISVDSKNSIVLAIDRVGYAIDDTKILDQDGTIINIGHDIEPSTGVCTGFFLCSPKFFSYAETVATEDNGELDDCIRVAARNNDTQVLDISGYFWVDVDTKKDLERAKKAVTDFSQTEN